MTDYLTPREVSELIGLAEITLAHWRYLRRGPRFVKLGRKVMYARADLDSWIAEQRVATDD